MRNMHVFVHLSNFTFPLERPLENNPNLLMASQDQGGVIRSNPTLMAVVHADRFLT